MDELNVNFNLSENEELNANFQLQNEDLSANFSLNDNEEIKAGFSLSENNLGANFALNEEESIEATFKVNVTPSKVSQLENDLNFVDLEQLETKQDKGDYIDNIESRGNITVSRSGSNVYLSVGGVTSSEFHTVVDRLEETIGAKQDKGDYALKEELDDYALKTAMGTQLNSKADISFHNVTTTGRSYVASWLAPSSKYINYAWSANNYLEYVAPSYGYFWASMHGSSASSYVEWCHVNNGVQGLQCRSYGTDPKASIYVKKGQTVRLFWSGVTFFYYIRFFYCLGSEWEAEE